METGLVKRTISLAEGEQEFAFRLSHNTMCEMQGKLGYAYTPDGDAEFFRDLAEGRAYRGFKRLRTLLHGALLEKQPKTTEALAGEIITALGFPKTSALVKELMEWTVPEPEPGEAASEGKAPEPSAGTGS